MEEEATMMAAANKISMDAAIAIVSLGRVAVSLSKNNKEWHLRLFLMDNI